MAYKFQQPAGVPTVDHERVLVCNECGDPVIVAELPGRFLDPATYIEGACLEERTQARESGVKAAPVPYNQFPPGY